MSCIKAPLSLRSSFVKTSLSTTAAMACACTFASGAAFAEEKVDAKKTKLAPVVVETTSQAESGANPHANPEAPYKIETLSSPKYTRPIAETPKSITVIGKEAMSDAGAIDLSDVMKAQPGITIGTGEGGNAFGDRYIIRGFEARNDVFVDGLRDPGVTVRDLFAVEQIEVSKGPSSSFAGRGTTGGAINNVTKKPGEKNFTKIEAGVGTDSRQRYTVDNNTLITDKVGLRTNLMFLDRDVPGRSGAEEEHMGGATALKIKASDRFTINADYYHQNTNDIPDGGVPWDAIARQPVPGSNFYGQERRDFWDTSSNIGTLGLEYEFNDDVKLVNQTRYGVTTNKYVLTIPGLSAPGAATGAIIGLSTPGVFARANSQSRDQENTYAGNQTNLMWDAELGGMKHSFVFGTEFSWEDAENLPFTDAVRSPNAGNPLAPNSLAWIQQGGSLTTNPAGYAKLEIDTWSLYAMDTWTINDDWELFGGLRYDTFDYSIVSGATAYTGATTGKLSTDEGFLNGHAGVVYSPWKNGNVYASFSTSSNPTGEQLDAFTNCAYGGLCQDSAGRFPEPEQNTNFELGTKWELMNKKLLLTGAVFQINKENVISSEGGRGTPVVVTQVGELRVRGVEVGLSGNLTEKLSGQAGLAFLDTEITKSDTPAEVGSKFPNTAETSATLQLRYQATDDWAFGGTVTYRGKISGGTPNAAVSGNSLDGYTKLDLMTEYKITKAATLRLNVLNVTDELYYDALYRSTSPFVYVGEGRSAFLTLAYEF